MFRLPGTLLVFVLATLLLATTPIGTGEGAHQGEMLHPVLPHVHLINGRIISHDEADAAARAPAAPRRPAGTAVGAGSGAEAAGIGSAIYPNVPVSGLVLPSLNAGPTAMTDVPVLYEFLDAPPDPPPHRAG